MSKLFTCDACWGNGIIDENGMPLPGWQPSALTCATCDGYGTWAVDIVVSGDRKWDEPDPIREFLHQLNPRSKVITGGAPGADTLADQIAAEYGLDRTVIEANWKKFGRAAGPIRNKQMLALDPHAVVFFHKDLDASKGTLNCVLEARTLNIEVIDGWNWYTSLHHELF